MKFPAVKIIDWYIIRKFLGTYFFSLSLIIVIVVIFDAVERMDDFVELKAPLSAILFQYYLNFIPFFANQYSGLFTFMAVVLFTSKMAYNTEIVAILSSGVSFRRILWPYFLSASVIVLVSLLLNLYVIPAANVQRIKFEQSYFKSRQNTKFEPNIFRQIEPGTFVYIRNFAGAENTADYFVLETYDRGKITSSLEAYNVKFEPETGRWTAPQSVSRLFEGEKETFDNEKRLDTLINLTAMELGRVQDLVKTMNINKLNAFIQQQVAKGSDMIAFFEVERQNRYSFPVSTFILTVIGVSLSSRKVRGGTGLHIGLGFLLCFTFIFCSKFADEFAKGGGLNPIVSVWMPNLIYALIAIYVYHKAPK